MLQQHTSFPLRRMFTLPSPKRSAPACADGALPFQLGYSSILHSYQLSLGDCRCWKQTEGRRQLEEEMRWPNAHRRLMRASVRLFTTLHLRLIIHCYVTNCFAKWRYDHLKYFLITVNSVRYWAFGSKRRVWNIEPLQGRRSAVTGVTGSRGRGIWKVALTFEDYQAFLFCITQTSNLMSEKVREINTHVLMPCCVCFSCIRKKI